MLTRRWQIEPTCPPSHLSRFAQFSPLIAQILFNRGITDLGEARSFLFDDSVSEDPFGMTGMAEAVERLRAAIRVGEPVAVYGDFDADGVTATALLVQALKSLGALVQPYIPHRIEEGYGLNMDALASLKDKGASIVVTVDCGIRSIHEVEYASSLGLDMIITDHHSVGEELPLARAVVNPKQVGDSYPFKEFSGAGLAFKLAQAMLKAESRAPLGTSAPVPENALLDLVALGTVADLVPLVSENRALVKRGIECLNHTERPGLVAMMKLAGARNRKIDAGTIGYFLGPRLNAAGRIEHARTAYNLLTTQYPGEADALAQKLEATNRERQQLTETMVNRAREIISAQEPDQPILIAASPDFPEGIVGLVASKLSEDAYRPAIAIHVGEKQSRGSARSIPEFNIVAAFDECADLLVRHGGHAAAAGFTVENDNLGELRARLRTLAEREFAESRLVPTLHIDAVAELGDMNWQTLEALERIAPFGYGNREPVFMTRGAWVRGARVVGNHHLGLTFTDGTVVWDGIAFRRKDWAPALNQLPLKVDVVYSLSSRNWGGRTAFAVGCERPAASRMTNDRAYPARPFCGVGVVAFRKDSIVLIRRGKEPRRGEWSIPGGAVELGERIRDAAVREFVEECGGSITLKDLVDAVDIIARDQNGRVSYHYVVADFWAEWAGGDIAPASDVIEARWVTTGDLDAFALAPWTRAVIEKAVKMRGSS